MKEVLNIDRWWGRAVILFVIVRLVMTLLMFFDIPRMDYHVGWAFYHGGDEQAYFANAQKILAGDIKFVTISGGWSLWIALAARLTTARDYEDTLPITVTFNGIILSALSVWAMAELTRLLTGDRWKSFVAMVGWALSPYILWVVFTPFPKAIALQNVFVPRQMWLNGLTDAPSIFCIMLGMVLLLRAYKVIELKTWLWVFAGIALGLAMSVRIHTGAMVLPMLLALAWNHKWRGLLLLGIGMVIGFIPQMAYSGLAGNFLDVPYISSWLGPNARSGTRIFWLQNMPFAPQFLLQNISRLVNGNFLLGIVGLVLLAIVVWAFIQAWRQRGSAEAFLMFFPPLGSFVVHVSTYLFFDDPIRFTIPALTIGIPAMVWSLFTIGQLFRTLWQKRMSFK